jgi:hypothetical protein
MINQPHCDKWLTQDGRLLVITEMATPHLKNALTMCRDVARHQPPVKRPSWMRPEDYAAQHIGPYRQMEAELRSRNPYTKTQKAPEPMPTNDFSFAAFPSIKFPTKTLTVTTVTTYDVRSEAHLEEVKRCIRNGVNHLSMEGAVTETTYTLAGRPPKKAPVVKPAKKFSSKLALAA